MPQADNKELMPEPEPLQLLLVEDEPTQQLILARKLTRAGYLVDTAGNGREALDKLLSGNYPLLITDWDMPEMDGVALCRALRAVKLPNYVYTLLLTGREGLDNVVAGLEAGADDYLVKPVDAIELKARLATGRRIIELEKSLQAANERNRLLSIADPLTGIFNRRYLMEHLPRELERAARYGRPLSLIMCDLDHFKRVNDRHGHLAGDEVLRATVGQISRSVRATDWVARYGGEEFVIVLPETTLANARIVAEQLRSRIEIEPFSVGELQMNITVSLGVVGWEQALPPKVTIDELIARCDACLYASKAAGRNQVTGEAMR